MDQTHIHLFIAHLPLFGSALALIVLLLGMRWKNSPTLKAAYILLLISSLGAVLAYLTGEAAEETAEMIPVISESSIDAHEDAGKLALFSFVPLGLLALAGLFFGVKKWARVVPPITVIVTIIGCVIAFRAASLGGKIRHTEIENPLVSEVPQPAPGKAEHSLLTGVTLDRGKKWRSNPETSAAISKMLAHVNALPEDPSPAHVAELKNALKYEFAELVRQCTMTGAAHDQLHNYILPLRDRIDALGAERTGVVVPEIQARLMAYNVYFE